MQVVVTDAVAFFGMYSAAVAGMACDSWAYGFQMGVAVALGIIAIHRVVDGVTAME